MSVRHLNQSNHIEKLVSVLIKDFTDYPDWAITTTFYFAMHRMQAALLKDFHFNPDKHLHPLRQRSRNTLVSIHYAAIANSYMKLFHESMKARYVPGYQLTTKMVDITKDIENALVEFKQYPK